MRRLTLLIAAALALPAPAAAAVRLPGEGLVALSAGRGAAYAIVTTGARQHPFRLVRSGGRRATSLKTFGSPGAEFADVSGAKFVFARPTSEGYSYEIPPRTKLGEGTGPPVLAPEGLVFPDADGDAVLGGIPLTHTGPALRHTPLDAVAGPLVLDLVQSATRSELRVIGSSAPDAPLVSVRGLHAIPATIARDRRTVAVAYRVRSRVVVATAPARTGGRWSRRRLRTRGAVNGAPAVARAGLRTMVATSQRVHGRRSIFLTTAGPDGTLTRRLTRPRGSDLAPLASQGPDGRVYVAWTRRTNGHRGRSALLRRVL